MPAVPSYALAAKGAPFTMATTLGATRGEAHVHAAPVRHRAARRAPEGISWRTQIIHLRKRNVYNSIRVQMANIVLAQIWC